MTRAHFFFKSRPRDLIRSQGGGDPARSDRWRILSHLNWLTWLGWRVYCPIWLFYAAVLALSLNVLPFEPFDQAFPADSRARPTKQLLTVDRCRTGGPGPGRAWLANSRATSYTGHTAAHTKERNWRGGVQLNTGVACSAQLSKRNILALLFKLCSAVAAIFFVEPPSTG